MNGQNFIEKYLKDPILETYFSSMASQRRVQIRNLAGSLPAVWVSANSQISKEDQFVILSDTEEAGYFYDDVLHLVHDEADVLYFPPSYKRIYEFEETDNANVVSRSEVLSSLKSESNKPRIIVSCSEALPEKVISKKNLVENSIEIRKGGDLDQGFLIEFLSEYGFEKTDFVYEPGQFSLRGGIVDVFSFANDKPFRLEFFGDVVESIREFNPNDQLSQKDLPLVNILPNIRGAEFLEERIPIFDFLNRKTQIWVKDLEHCFITSDQVFEKAIELYEGYREGDDERPIVLPPKELFLDRGELNSNLAKFSMAQFGFAKIPDASEEISYSSSPQPSFNKNFDLIKDDLKDRQEAGFALFLATDQMSSIDRLQEIFKELDPELEIKTLLLGLKEGFVDDQQKILCYTEHQLFERFYRIKGKEKFSRSRAISMNQLRELQIGDYVTHIDYGVGRFVGLEKREVNDRIQESIRLIYKDNDILLVGIHALHKISKYTGKDGEAPVISKLGSPEWENKKKRAKRKVKDIAKDLIELYAKRKKNPGFEYAPDSYLQAELETSFIYEDTPDQAKATSEVKDDMENPHPMDRLVCGDVGFGKTEVAIRAAFKAATEGKQVAVLVPTTVLALQHFKTFKERLKDFPVDIEYLNRFRTAAQTKRIILNLEEGKTDIVIGTHKLVGRDVKFKDLGLLIIDEEQKFGVSTKEKLKKLRVNVDVLTLTATPIPRTLQFSLMGAKDFSVITTPPPNRQPVQTDVMVFNEKIIRDAISFELSRGGQVFFVHNRIRDIDEIAGIVKKLVPEASMAIAHGQMDGKILEKTMVGFIEREFDILVSTNIIESGLDIPNANTIIINQAQNFGLSDLHQMRGRVGRSNKKAFCYFLTPPLTGLSGDARKRLQTLSEFSELGDGYKVALRDLDIRGAGNLLGGEQSGFINDLGLETYHKILDEAVQELKETEFKDLFMGADGPVEIVKDSNLETDWEVLIPENYVSNISERLRLYTRLDNLRDQDQVDAFLKELEDRFGPIPDEVKVLVRMLELRWMAQKIGFSKVSIKNGRMRCFFPENSPDYFQGEMFGTVLNYVKNNPKNSSLKDLKGSLVLSFSGITLVDHAQQVFSKILTEKGINTRNS